MWNASLTNFWQKIQNYKKHFWIFNLTIFLQKISGCPKNKIVKIQFDEFFILNFREFFTLWQLLPSFGPGSGAVYRTKELKLRRKVLWVHLKHLWENRFFRLFWQIIRDWRIRLGRWTHRPSWHWSFQLSSSSIQNCKWFRNSEIPRFAVFRLILFCFLTLFWVNCKYHKIPHQKIMNKFVKLCLHWG